MKIYWTRKSFPELAHLPRARRNWEFLRAWTAARRDSRTLENVLDFVLAAGSLGLTAWVAELAGLGSRSGALLGGAVGGFVMAQRQMARVQRKLENDPPAQREARNE